jgi:hypothetical protein
MTFLAVLGADKTVLMIRFLILSLNSHARGKKNRSHNA